LSESVFVSGSLKRIKNPPIACVNAYMRHTSGISKETKSMAAVTIYTKVYCPFCERALALLGSKGADITDIEAASKPEIRAKMNALTGRNTFPQIFIGSKHIGGCDDLMALNAAGELDGLLAA
jgi:glutaredoxin 3